MAIQKLTYPSKTWLPITTGICQDVYLCLSDVWAGRTVSGIKLIPATIENTGRYLGNNPYPEFENPRGVHQYQYALSINDAVFLDDPETEAPYLLSCADILEVFPFACTLGVLLGETGVLTGSDLTLVGSQPAVAGLTSSIQRVGSNFRLLFNLAGVVVNITDGDVAGSFGNLKIFDFAEMAFSVQGTRQNYPNITANAALTAGGGDAAMEIGLGTTAIVAAADGVLAAGNENIGSSIAFTQVANVGSGALVEGDRGSFDGTAGALDLFINMSGTAATIEANGTQTITGQIEINGTLLGDD